MVQRTEDTDTEKTSPLNAISNLNGEGFRNRGDWLIFDTDSGTLFLRKSRHRVTEGEDGELNTVFITTLYGEALDPSLFASDENFRAS